MDDVLVNFDPRRASAAARSIVELSHERQVLFFTCHPTMVDAGSELLVRSCRHEGLEVHGLPGIRYQRPARRWRSRLRPSALLLL